jgi:hypothetical protein
MADLWEKLSTFTHRRQDVPHSAPRRTQAGSRVTAYKDDVSAQSVGADASCATMWPNSRQSGRPSFGPRACRLIDVLSATRMPTASSKPLRLSSLYPSSARQLLLDDARELDNACACGGESAVLLRSQGLDSPPPPLPTSFGIRPNTSARKKKQTNPPPANPSRHPRHFPSPKFPAELPEPRKPTMLPFTPASTTPHPFQWLQRYECLPRLSRSPSSGNAARWHSLS